MSNLFSYLRLPVIASSAVAVVGSSLLYFKQNELIYPRGLPIGSRTEDGMPKPSEFGIKDKDWEDLRLTTADGETLSCFFIRPQKPSKKRKTTVMMFHGNAGNVGHRIPVAQMLERTNGCSVLMMEYRGYGLSTGTPDEKGLKLDSQAGLDWLRSYPETKDSNIVVFGQSLGGAVAVDLVARNQHRGDIAGLVLENTFLSIRKMIPSAFPPARYLAPLCHQLWPTEETLPQIADVPILFISGLHDEIVPPWHMKQLHEICRTNVKIWREFASGSHNDTIVEPNYFEYISEFINDKIISRN